MWTELFRWHSFWEPFACAESKIALMIIEGAILKVCQTVKPYCMIHLLKEAVNKRWQSFPVKYHSTPGLRLWFLLRYFGSIDVLTILNYWINIAEVFKRNAQKWCDGNSHCVWLIENSWFMIEKWSDTPSTIMFEIPALLVVLWLFEGVTT